MDPKITPSDIGKILIDSSGIEWIIVSYDTTLGASYPVKIEVRDENGQAVAIDTITDEGKRYVNDPKPEYFWAVKENGKTVQDRHKCTCDIFVLMNLGCQCGGK